MKCQSCGYVHEVRSEWVNEAIFFKSGKNKGNFKEAKQREVRLEVGNAEFETVTFIKSIGQNFNQMMIEEQTMTICPECRCVTQQGEF